jgi:hypothetical protein
MSKAHKILELRSPPYGPGTRGHQVATYAADLRPIQPLGRCLVLDVETAARFAIERLDELEPDELRALTGSSTLPDGTPAKGLRIAWRRYRAGAGGFAPASFHALLYLELDTVGMEARLRSIAADGFGEAKEEAARRARAPVTVAGAAPDGELETPDGPPPASSPGPEESGAHVIPPATGEAVDKAVSDLRGFVESLDKPVR